MSPEQTPIVVKDAGQYQSVASVLDLGELQGIEVKIRPSPLGEGGHEVLDTWAQLLAALRIQEKVVSIQQVLFLSRCVRTEKHEAISSGEA